MAYDAHMFALWVCVVIGVLVFGAMAYAMFKFRKSKGAVADTLHPQHQARDRSGRWSRSCILVAMAWPATAS